MQTRFQSPCRFALSMFSIALVAPWMFGAQNAVPVARANRDLGARESGPKPEAKVGERTPITASQGAAMGPPAAAFGDKRFVNDDMGEVDSADVADGSLTGADVSTSSGDVTFSGAVLTAQQGVFGRDARVSGTDATVSGGWGCVAGGSFSTASGGVANSALASSSTISGGVRNTTTSQADESVIGGGRDNTVSRQGSVISGGASNTAEGIASTVSGGYLNAAVGNFSTVSGGINNAASGSYSVAVGSCNRSYGDNSLTLGHFARAMHKGSFVWGDSTFVDKPSSADDEFNVYAEGGVRMFAIGPGSPSLVVDPGGNVGIGTPTPAERLHVAGNICATGSIASCSDERYKESVEPLAGALESIRALRGVSFTWKAEELPQRGFTQGRQIGFLAQEVLDHVPEIVSRGNDGYYRVDYGRLTPVLVEALQELDERVESLAEENQKLRARLEALHEQR